MGFKIFKMQLKRLRWIKPKPFYKLDLHIMDLIKRGIVEKALI